MSRAAREGCKTIARFFIKPEKLQNILLEEYAGKHRTIPVHDKENDMGHVYSEITLKNLPDTLIPLSQGVCDRHLEGVIDKYCFNLKLD